MKLNRLLAAAVAAGLALCAPAAALAQKTSDLPTAATLTGAEQVAMSQGSGCATHVAPCASVKAPLSTIGAYVGGSLDAQLLALAALSPSSDQCIYWTSSTAASLYGCTSFSRGLGTNVDAPSWRTALGLGTLATQSGTFSGTSSGTNTGDQTTISGNAGTATKWATARTIAITGDLAYTSPSLDGSGNVTAAGTLATVNSNVGTCGSGTSIPAITLNAKGLATACTTTTLPSYVPCKSAVAVPLTGSTSETTLATCTIPGNTLGANGQIEIWALFSWTNNANTKTPRVKFGSMVIQSSSLSGNASQQFLLRLANRNATNSQVAFPTSASGTGTGAANAPTTAAIDTTSNVDITITGQLATGTDTMTLESYMVRVTPG